jgi:hypothetical protein
MDEPKLVYATNQTGQWSLLEDSRFSCGARAKSACR